MVSKGAIRDKSVDPFSLGIYVKILAFGETDWELNLFGLAKHLELTEERIRRSFRILEDAGYMSRQRVRDEKNHFVGWDYILYAAPTFGNPRPSENPDVGKTRPSENPGVNNNTINKTQDYKNKEKREDNTITPPPFNFYRCLLDLGVSREVADAWMEIRRKAKASNSEIAFKGIVREIAKAGLPADDCIRIAVEKSWRGFEADWLKAQRQNAPRPQAPSPRRPESVWEANARIAENIRRSLMNPQPYDEQ